ncbi:MAG: FapA family protein [Pseudomonadota bacterium]
MDVIRVAGNLDYEIGNVNCQGSVYVDGDVLPGFSIQAGGSVCVNGSVDASRVTAGGQVEVGEGIVKQSQVSSGKSIVAGHISQSFLDSTEDVTVRRDSTNCTVHAGGKISLYPNGCVVGGGLFAKGDIEVGTAGSPKGIRTVLAAGSDPFKELGRTRLQINLEKAESVRVRLKKLSDLVKAAARQRTKQAMDKQIDIQKQIQKRLDAMEKVKFPSQPVHITVLHEIHEGVWLQIGGAKKDFREPYPGATFEYDKKTKGIVKTTGRKTK